MEGFIIVLIFIGVGLVAIAAANHRGLQASRREQFIASYSFPETISKKLRATYPHLTEEDTRKVIQALRNYFSVCRMAGLRMVSMPSQAVDVAWHEFILFTRDYDIFCQAALGRFLHHTPAEAMQGRTLAQDGIKRAWRLACQREGIDPKRPGMLPLLFAIDAQLNIPDGFRYTLDCMRADDQGFCASHIGCGSSGCGGSSGGGDGGHGHGGHGDGGGHGCGGHGCGGSGCGGGGCGGGGGD